MYSRRKFLRNIASASGSAFVMLNSGGVAAAARLIEKIPPTVSARETAADEIFWKGIQNSFDVDRSIINLNSGAVSSSPRTVIDSFKKQIDYTNLAPSRYLWDELEPKAETVREKLAEMLGCSNEEIAITRNTSESLEIVQFGMNLKKGDAVLTTVLDYPRMINTFDMMNRRYGVDIIKVKYPVPLMHKEDYIEAIRKGITKNTKLILISHICYATGQILPVAEISKIADEHNIKVLCDGAHSFNHIPFKLSDLKCHFFGSSLHKWTYAPIGTGFLYVKKELIKDIWPLMSAPVELDNDIRKFEDIGTHPAANHNAVLEALEFNKMIGAERKTERLRYLNKLWINEVRQFPNIKFNVNVENESNYAGIVNFNIDKIKVDKAEEYLRSKYKIYITSIETNDFTGLRVSPNIYTTLEEIEKFTEAIKIIASGQVKELFN